MRCARGTQGAKKEPTSASVSSMRGYLAKNISSTGVFGDEKRKKER